MSDLISREKTLYRLATSAVYYFDLEEDQAAHDWAMHIVSGMPDEEPEIVRCRGCIYWNHQTDFTYCDRTVWYGTDADDFCSFAERRADE